MWTSFSYERLIVTVSVVVLVLSKVLSEVTLFLYKLSCFSCENPVKEYY